MTRTAHSPDLCDHRLQIVLYTTLQYEITDNPRCPAFTQSYYIFLNNPFAIGKYIFVNNLYKLQING